MAGVLNAEPRLLDQSQGYGTALIDVGNLEGLRLRLWQLHPASSCTTGCCMAGGARNQTERTVGSIVQGHQPDREPRDEKLGKLVKLYLGQRPQNAASNVPLSSRIFIF
jgi:hypothetical protein